MKVEKTDKQLRVPNGAYAIVDKDNKLVAYSRWNEPEIKKNVTFDWIRRDRC